MTRDLFGGPQRQPISRLSKGSVADPKREPLQPMQGTSGRPQFYFLGGRSFTRDELLRLVDFDGICARYPDDDLILVLETSGTRVRAYIVALLRNHPSRFDAIGRRDPLLQPFWGHGDILNINAVERPP